MNEEDNLALQHMDLLHNMQLNFHVDNQLILEAGERDRAQNNFINAVFNTRRAGEDVSAAITEMSKEALQLRKGEFAAKKLLKVCQEKIRHVSSLLEALDSSADTVSDPVDYRVEKLEECHQVASNIKLAAMHLKTALDMFEVSLDEDPVNEAPENFHEVLAKRDELYTLVNSFPALHRNNFRIEAIQRSVMNVTGRNN